MKNLIEQLGVSLIKKTIPILIIVAIVASGVLALYLYMNKTNEFPNSPQDPDIPVIPGSAIIVNHYHAHLEDFINIPNEWLEAAKDNLSIVYWHTSHGSQITTGMNSLDAFMGDNDIYEFNSAGTGGALHYYEPSIDYAERHLTGNTDGFDDTTRSFLDSHSEYNVVLWSWCALDKNNDSINQYLTNMNQLESEYPEVSFVYMTGHLEGTGEEGSLHYYNEQIRDYCIDNNKTLYDFADIESYDPNDNYFLNKSADDNCDYDSDGNGSRDANWAEEWQESHIGDQTYPNRGEWYDCSPAHTQAINGNMKAYAAWYLFARLAGWNDA